MFKGLVQDIVFFANSKGFQNTQNRINLRLDPTVLTSHQGGEGGGSRAE